jgi:hypothetical protein
MTTFARVPTVPGTVLEIYTGSSLFAMHPDIAATWHVAPNGTQVGDHYDGTNFTSGAVTLSQAKANKIVELTNTYKADLINGFTSSALGAPHNYANDAIAQATLNSLIIAGNTADYIYYTGGIPTYASHTLAELQQVLDDLIADRDTTMSNYESKVATANAAATINDVNAVTW